MNPKAPSLLLALALAFVVLALNGCEVMDGISDLAGSGDDISFSGTVPANVQAIGVRYDVGGGSRATAKAVENEAKRLIRDKGYVSVAVSDRPELIAEMDTFGNSGYADGATVARLGNLANVQAFLFVWADATQRQGQSGLSSVQGTFSARLVTVEDSLEVWSGTITSKQPFQSNDMEFLIGMVRKAMAELPAKGS